MQLIGMAVCSVLSCMLLCCSVVWGLQGSNRHIPEYVAIRVEQPGVQGPRTLGASLFVVTQGTFSTLGALENAERNLCLVDKDFLLNFHQSYKLNHHWIGLLYDNEEDDDEFGVEETEEERDNRGNRKSSRQEGHGSNKNKSLTENMKDILLLGASAIIIVVKNVRLKKELDIAHVFAKPVILLYGVENVTKIIQLFLLRYDTFAKIQKNFPHYRVAGTIGTVTLWPTCGRSTSGAYHEWKEVVCIGNSRITNIAMDKYFTAMAWKFCFLLLICFVIYIYVILTRNGLDGIGDLNNEVDNQGLARHVLSQMRIEIYRSRGRTSGKMAKRSYRKNSCIKKFENAPDQCVICLDSFFPLQRLRVLPCNHSFHLSCIDKWLLTHHTCPMCKFNILDHHRMVETESGEYSS